MDHHGVASVIGSEIASQQLARKQKYDVVRDEILAQKLELARGTERNKELKQVIDMAKSRHTSSNIEIKAREQDLREGTAKQLHAKRKKEFPGRLRGRGKSAESGQQDARLSL